MHLGGSFIPKNGAEAFVRLLEAHDVRHIFGLCGDTSLPFYDALYRLEHGISHILTRDERCAAYMADGYARVTSRVGVCEGPSGGGATYILPGVIEANDSSVPLLAITSDVAVTSQGHYPLTELRQDELFSPLTKWNGVVKDLRMLPSMVRAAFRAMTTGRPGAAHLGLPFDIQQSSTKGAILPQDIWTQKQFCSFPAWPAAPSPLAAEEVIKIILAAKRPVIICGGGVVLSGAQDALDCFAKTLNITVATTVSGQGALADNHPNNLGVVGSNGGVAVTRKVVDDADLVIFVGCRAGSVTTQKWESPSMTTEIIHIDSDPMVIAANYPTKAAIVADIKLSFEALNTILDDMKNKVDFFGDIQVKKAKKIKFADFNQIAIDDSTPIRPERIVAELNNVLPSDATIVVDPGTPCPYFSAFYNIPHAGRYLITNRAHGALGYALGAAIGAQFGRPNAKTVAIMGDGSFGFTVGELETVKRYQLPIIFIVLSNSSYGWIKAGQKTGFEKRYYSVDFTRTNHADVARAFGIKSWTVKDPRELRKVFTDACKCDSPVLVDIITQPLQEANAPVSEWIA